MTLCIYPLERQAPGKPNSGWHPKTLSNYKRTIWTSILHLQNLSTKREYLDLGSKKASYSFLNFYCIYGHGGGNTQALEYGRSGNNWSEPVLSFYHIGLKDWTGVIRCGSKCPFEPPIIILTRFLMEKNHIHNRAVFQNSCWTCVGMVRTKAKHWGKQRGW